MEFLFQFYVLIARNKLKGALEVDNNAAFNNCDINRLPQ